MCAIGRGSCDAFFVCPHLGFDKPETLISRKCNSSWNGTNSACQSFGVHPIPDKASHPNFPHIQSIEYVEHADQPQACCKTQRKQQNAAEKKRKMRNLRTVSARRSGKTESWEGWLRQGWLWVMWKFVPGFEASCVSDASNPGPKMFSESYTGRLWASRVITRVLSVIKYRSRKKKSLRCQIAKCKLASLGAEKSPETSQENRSEYFGTWKNRSVSAY